MSKASKLINAILPPVPKTDDRQTLQFFSAIKQALDEIKNSVVVSKQGVVSRIGSDAAKDELAAAIDEAVLDPDALRTPSAVVNLTASGTVTNINLSWDYPATGTNVGYFEVFRNTVDAQGTATIRGTTGATVFGDNAEPRQQYYYWVRGVSSGGVRGPFQSDEGVAGITAENPLTALATAQCGIVCSNLSSLLLQAIPSISGADCANTTAGNALTCAGNALTCASCANTTAGNALTCASCANTTAGNALTCAGTANTTAGNALTCATTAVSCSTSAITASTCACTVAIAAQCAITTTNNCLAAHYMVKTDVEGNVAGFGLYNDGCVSDFQILADSFAVTHNTTLSSCIWPSGRTGATTLNAPEGSVDTRLTGYCKWTSTLQCDGSGTLCSGPQFPYFQVRDDRCSTTNFLAEAVIKNANCITCADELVLCINWIRVRNPSTGGIGIVCCDRRITAFTGIGPPGPGNFTVYNFNHYYAGPAYDFCYRFASIPSGSYTEANGYTQVDAISYALYEGSTKTPFIVCNNQVFINQATIADASISSAMIQSLDADKISATCLSALSTNAGCITAGVLRSADGDFVIDLTNKNITITV